MRFLGLQDVSEAEHAQFMQWSRDLAVFIGVPVADKSHWRAAQRSIMQMAAFFNRVFTQRRVAADSLLARLGQAQAAGEISDAELIAQSAMLLFAGHETTRHLLGTSVLRLLENPAQWQHLQTQPALAPNAVRELLRATGARVLIVAASISADTALLVRSASSIVAVPVTFPNSPRTLLTIMWRTENCALECEVSIFHSVPAALDTRGEANTVNTASALANESSFTTVLLIRLWKCSFSRCKSLPL